MYSQESIQSALTANESQRTLHRAIITVGDCIAKQEEEEFMDRMNDEAPSYEEQRADYLEAHNGKIDDFRLSEEDTVK